MADLAGQHIGDGRIGPAVGAGGIGIIDPSGQAVAELRKELQHPADKGSIRRIQHEFDHVGIPSQLKFAFHAQILLRLFFRGAACQRLADHRRRLNGNQRQRQAPHHQVRPFPVLSLKKHGPDKHGQEDQCPDHQVARPFPVRQLHPGPCQGNHRPVQEHCLDIGGQSKPQWHGRGDSPRPGRQRQQHQREKQPRGQSDPQLKPPDVLKGKIEFPRVHQHHFHRGEERHGQGQKQTAGQNCPRGPPVLFFHQGF